MNTSLSKDGSRYVVRFERLLSHLPKKVWRVLTEGELLKDWFPCEVLGGWAKGAKLRFVFKGNEQVKDETLHGEVLSVEPLRLLEYQWGKSILRFELHEVSGGCRLVFSESFEDGSIAARNAAGWEMCLAGMEAILQDETPAEFSMAAWRVPYARYVLEFEPLAGSQQGPPESLPAVLEEKAEIERAKDDG